jgi:hypothetical protein
LFLLTLYKRKAAGKTKPLPARYIIHDDGERVTNRPVIHMFIKDNMIAKMLAMMVVVAFVAVGMVMNMGSPAEP